MKSSQQQNENLPEPSNEEKWLRLGIKLRCTRQYPDIARLLDAPSLENEHARVVSCGARHSAVVTGAREIVRLTTHSEPDDLFDSVIAGFGTGALLDRLQGGVPGVVRYSIGIAIVGTGIDYAAIKLRPVFKNMYESVAASDEKKNSWFKWPEWLPIQVLDEELKLQNVHERKICESGFVI